MPPALGPRHADVRRLRALLRDRATRRSEGAFVVEGPHAVEAALDRGAAIERVYLGPGAERAFPALVARLREAGVSTAQLKEGVLERVGTTVTPQPVLAVAPTAAPPLDAIPAAGLVLVAVGVADPGNLGTLLRSAEAAGVAAVVCTGGGVDAYNPKAVRASAGAVFGVTVAEHQDVDAVLAHLRAQGRRLFGTAGQGGHAPEHVDLAVPSGVLVGSEAHGLDPGLAAMLDATITIPMTPPPESLNVATAAAVIAFEAARQRRGSSRSS